MQLVSDMVGGLVALLTESVD
ncbi:hypothetical protein BIFADO_02331 [Bifidobacterium adolescentis L2-32]|uniref:Uncharacterized protein n=1 Tax=Bifidobacterium adolescentis L2-32 TaxID=411481 RepID=A7A8Y7_BIFAD|nr:hypothetical protein BIFADO_02330 [Bifidobacterium adolescentis L2-32]EDN82203.1 hypothetical protein BIFADO_02331 [Bifidobacterium adolescentis L2-32]